MDLKEQEILGPDLDRHWYYVSKGRALRALVGDVTVPELLDVGAGSGVFARQMLDAGLASRAVCVDPNYDEEWVERRDGREVVFLRSVAQVTQHLVLMIDVLEHVPDDRGLLRSYADRAPPGCLLLISVPAFEWLWSGHDVFLGHQRRYTLAEVETLAQEAGLEVVRGRYFFASLLPLVVLGRWYDRWRLGRGVIEPRSALRRQPAMVDAALASLHALERHSIFRINRLAGLSALCLARRPGSGPAQDGRAPPAATAGA